MNKPIPYGRQRITNADIDEVKKVLKSNYITQGPKIEEFESNFASYVGSKYAVAVSSATAALHISVKALGLGRGEKVITTPISFAASSNCIRYCGGQVWFADINPNTYLISIQKIKELIESKPRGFFKGIIPVNFGGLSVDTEKLKKIANENNLWIIEDASHSPGSYFFDSKGLKNMSGNCKFSDLTVFFYSIQLNILLAARVEMITTNNQDLYKKLCLLRSHGIERNVKQQNNQGWYYDILNLGFNYRLTDFQAALGLSQLKKNIAGVKKRNSIAKVYINNFKGKIKFQQTPEKFYNAYHLFVIEIENRLGLYNFLRKKNIFSQIHYIPIHTLSYYKDIGYENSELFNSENYYSKCLSLPMFPSLTKRELDYIIKNVLNFVNK